jgi:uncharacterized protein (TIGR03437 family)
MGATRKADLDGRLEAYFVTLRASSVRELLKRSAANWQIYAAVTSSAVAMATGASASDIGSGLRDVAADPVASVLASNRDFASFKNMPSMNAIRLAIARQHAGVHSDQTSPVGAPSISAGGIVPLFSTVNIIQPGEWVSIYGTNLASGIAVWNGDFPTLLGGTSVEIDGKPAYLEFVSPGQINLQAPDDAARGTVSVVVTTAAGSATSTVTLSDYGPSFSILDTAHVAGIIVRTNGTGAYGKGSYDILGPTGSSFGYPTVAANPGDIVELFAVGFGPTTPEVPAGEAFSGAAPVTNPITLYINNVIVKPSFVGLSGAGLYQINLVVPSGMGTGDVPLMALAGGMQTPAGVLFSLAAAGATNTGTGGGGTVGTVGPGNPGTGIISNPGVPGTGGPTGTGTGDDARHKRKKRYHPTLRFEPK